MTPEEKWSLNQVVAYARTMMADKNQHYLPTTHEESSSFLNQYGLKKPIDEYNKDASKKIDLTVFPTSPTLIIDSFLSWFKDGTSFPDPTICQQIPELAEYVIMTTDKRGIQVPSFDDIKKQELTTKLQDYKIIEKLVKISIIQTQDPNFLVKFSENKNNEELKEPSDYIGLLFTICLAPTTAANAWKFDVIDRKNLWQWITTELIGTGAQTAAIESKKVLEQDLTKAKEEKKDIETKIKEVSANKDNIYDTTQKIAKAKELSEQLTQIDEKIKDIERKLQLPDSQNIIVNTKPQKPVVSPPSPIIWQIEKIDKASFDKQLIEFIKQYEWRTPISKRDVKQYSRWYGTKAPSGWLSISREQAEQELLREIDEKKKYVYQYLKELKLEDKITGKRLLAFISIAYNAGQWNAYKILQQISQWKTDMEIATFMKEFCINKGTEHEKWLRKRREAESTLYASNTQTSYQNIT